MQVKVLQDVAAQKLGYRFGKPLRVDDKSLAVVLPILRETSLARSYTTFPETDKVLVFDTGKIDEMDADNQSGQNVFLRSGTLFRGATQERALQRSAVLFPGKKQRLKVRCVHASRGISGQAKVTYGGVTPLDFDAKNYAHGYEFKDQHATWSNVSSSTAHYMKAMGKSQGKSGFTRSVPDASRVSASHVFYASQTGDEMYDMAAANNLSASAFATSKSDDLHSAFNEFAAHFDEVLSKVKRLDLQAGLALITPQGVQTVEFFDHCDSWTALHEAAVKRLGSAIVDTGAENVFDYKPEAAVGQVARVLGADFAVNRIFSHRPDNGEPGVEIEGLTGGGYVGESVELDGRVVHLVLLKQAKP